MTRKRSKHYVVLNVFMMLKEKSSFTSSCFSPAMDSALTISLYLWIQQWNSNLTVWDQSIQLYLLGQLQRGRKNIKVNRLRSWTATLFANMFQAQQCEITLRESSQSRSPTNIRKWRSQLEIFRKIQITLLSTISREGTRQLTFSLPWLNPTPSKEHWRKKQQVLVFTRICKTSTWPSMVNRAWVFRWYESSLIFLLATF